MKFDKNINWTELAIKIGAGIWSGGAILPILLQAIKMKNNLLVILRVLLLLFFVYFFFKIFIYFFW
jgi:hypothetical protein